MTIWPVIRRGGRLKLMQMPWPGHPATILPGDPPELAPGERPGLGAFIVTATFTSITVRVDDKTFTLRPSGDPKLVFWDIS